MMERGSSQHGDKGSSSSSSGSAELFSDAFDAESSPTGMLALLLGYLERLREEPHNVELRVCVAELQLRLGRIDEAMAQYEGVLRSYVAHRNLCDALVLCEQLAAAYPGRSRLRRILIWLRSKEEEELPTAQDLRDDLDRLLPPEDRRATPHRTGTVEVAMDLAPPPPRDESGAYLLIRRKGPSGAYPPVQQPIGEPPACATQVVLLTSPKSR
jgi:hypothetical protein